MKLILVVAASFMSAALVLPTVSQAQTDRHMTEQAASRLLDSRVQSA